jgi:hypothetical protein
MTQPEENKTTLGRYVAALQSADEQAIRPFFAEGATWTLQAGEMPISGTWTGRDGKIHSVREYMDTLYACNAFWRAGSSHSAVGGGV